jgi:upstream activation factor subunit UAF30
MAKKKGTGLTSIEYDLSDELADVVGTDRTTRPNVIAMTWKYIKRHELQGVDDGDRRNIYLDDKLQAVFGNKKKITMFQMNSLLTPHLTRV